MFNRTIRRVVTAAALAALLAMASPVPVQAAGWAGWIGAETLVERIWSWLAGPGEISGTVERSESSGVQDKSGEVIGPDGGLNGESSEDPTCTRNEAGICIDPNG